jgi:hypothetical protein
VAGKGPNAYPSNAAYAQEYIGSLLTAQFPNMTAQQVGRRWAVGFSNGWGMQAAAQAPSCGVSM